MYCCFQCIGARNRVFQYCRRAKPSALGYGRALFVGIAVSGTQIVMALRYVLIQGFNIEITTAQLRYSDTHSEFVGKCRLYHGGHNIDYRSIPPRVLCVCVYIKSSDVRQSKIIEGSVLAGLGGKGRWADQVQLKWLPMVS